MSSFHPDGEPLRCVPTRHQFRPANSSAGIRCTLVVDIPSAPDRTSRAYQCRWLHTSSRACELPPQIPPRTLLETERWKHAHKPLWPGRSCSGDSPARPAEKPARFAWKPPNPPAVVAVRRFPDGRPAPELGRLQTSRCPQNYQTRRNRARAANRSPPPRRSSKWEFSRQHTRARFATPSARKPSLSRRSNPPGKEATYSGLHPFPESDRKSTRLNSSHLVISYAVF